MRKVMEIRTLMVKLSVEKKEQKLYTQKQRC